MPRDDPWPQQAPPPQKPPGRTRTVVTAGGAILTAVSIGLTAFLKPWESGREMVLVVYADKLAQGLPTVCDGLTRHVTATPIIVGEQWTADKCHAEQNEAIFRVQTNLAKCFRRADVPQSVFDMATSHAWNNGAGNTCSSLAMKAFNDGQWLLGCDRLSKSDAGKPVWSSVRTGKILPNGQPEMRFVQGLANRRGAETVQCKKDVS